MTRDFEMNGLKSQDRARVSAQFDFLIEDLLAGKMQRSRFETWEIEILLDILGCDLGRFGRVAVIRQYQRAVQRHMENGAAVPMKLSHFLLSRSAEGPAARRLVLEEAVEPSYPD